MYITTIADSYVQINYSLSLSLSTASVPLILYLILLSSRSVFKPCKASRAGKNHDFLKKSHDFF